MISDMETIVTSVIILSAFVIFMWALLKEGD